MVCGTILQEEREEKAKCEGGREGGEGRGNVQFVVQEVGRKQALQAFPRLGEVYEGRWR